MQSVIAHTFKKHSTQAKEYPKNNKSLLITYNVGVISYSSVTQLFFIGISTTYFDFAHVAKSIVPVFQSTSLRVDVWKKARNSPLGIVYVQSDPLCNLNTTRNSHYELISLLTSGWQQFCFTNSTHTRYGAAIYINQYKEKLRHPSGVQSH